jgi:hypothetical protein
MGWVGMFWGGRPVPTVGFGMGDVTLQNFLEGHDLLPALPPETDAYVVLLGDTVYERAQDVLARFREEGLRIAVDMTGRKVEKQIKTAVKKGISYVHIHRRMQNWLTTATSSKTLPMAKRKLMAAIESLPCYAIDGANTPHPPANQLTRDDFDI